MKGDEAACGQVMQQVFDTVVFEQMLVGNVLHQSAMSPDGQSRKKKFEYCSNVKKYDRSEEFVDGSYSFLAG